MKVALLRDTLLTRESFIPPFLHLSVAVLHKPQGSDGVRGEGFLGRQEKMDQEQEFNVLMEMFNQGEDQTPYVMLHAPEPYNWDMENCISHYDAIELGIACMEPFPNMKPCKRFRECVSCQSFKGTQWHQSHAAKYHEALKFFLEALPPYWRSMNSEGNEPEGIVFLDKILAKYPDVMKQLSHRGAVRM